MSESIKSSSSQVSLGRREETMITTSILLGLDSVRLHTKLLLLLCCGRICIVYYRFLRPLRPYSWLRMGSSRLFLPSTKCSPRKKSRKACIRNSTALLMNWLGCLREAFPRSQAALERIIRTLARIRFVHFFSTSATLNPALLIPIPECRFSASSHKMKITKFLAAHDALPMAIH